MPRHKTYNIEDVLSQATKLFLRKGYDSTSMNELVEVTGLNKQSMYQEFRDKEGLFLSCIKQYTLEDRNLNTVKILTAEPLGLKNIENFLEDRIDYALTRNCYGCLLVNTVAEKEVVSRKINKKINILVKHQEDLICNALEAAVKSGEISKDNNCHTLANYLSCFFRGLMNMAKGSQNNISMNQFKNMAMAAIKK